MRSACHAATSAMSVTWVWLIPRERIPVRSTIHSSDVSTSCSRSAFVSETGGRHFPQPVIVARSVIGHEIRRSSDRATDQSSGSIVGGHGQASSSWIPVGNRSPSRRTRRSTHRSTTTAIATIRAIAGTSV